MSSQCLIWGQCTPSVVGCRWEVIILLCCALVGSHQNRGSKTPRSVSLSEVHSKTTEVNGFTVPQIFFKHILLYQTSHAEKIWENQQHWIIMEKPGAALIKIWGRQILPYIKLMCEEQHMHNERVWNTKHRLVLSLAAGPAAWWPLNQHLPG